MQQTEKYKLNLIERNDVFSPDALNQNMEKVETAIAGAQAETAAEAAAGDAALAARVAALEGKNIVIGSYRGNGGTQAFSLPFTPSAVFILHRNASGESRAIVRGHDLYLYLGSNGTQLIGKIVENGFQVMYSTVSGCVNASGNDYVFFALP